MKKFWKITILVVAMLVIFATSSCLSSLNAVASSILGSSSSSSKKTSFTNSEAVAAMKDALYEGVKSASSSLSQKDGAMNVEITGTDASYTSPEI